MVSRANMLAMAPDELLDQICEDERIDLIQQLRQRADRDDAHLISKILPPKLQATDD